MFKIYRTTGRGTSITIKRGLLSTLWTVLKHNLNGYRTKIVRY
jgi:hypothetical protein